MHYKYKKPQTSFCNNIDCSNCSTFSKLFKETGQKSTTKYYSSNALNLIFIQNDVCGFAF